MEIGGLEKVRESLGDAFAATVELMMSTLDAGGLVVVTGVGKSLQVAEKMSAVFASTGTRSIVLNPVQAMHGDLGMTAPRDMLIALSFSGESEEIVKLVPAIRRHGLKIVAVTGDSESTLARMSDVVLPVPCGPEACPFGMAPTTSATATMVMGDALAMAMVEARKFTVEEYAGNHPAGAIGRALTRIADGHDEGEGGERGGRGGGRQAFGYLHRRRLPPDHFGGGRGFSLGDRYSGRAGVGLHDEVSAVHPRHGVRRRDCEGVREAADRRPAGRGW